MKIQIEVTQDGLLCQISYKLAFSDNLNVLSFLDKHLYYTHSYTASHETAFKHHLFRTSVTSASSVQHHQDGAHTNSYVAHSVKIRTWNLQNINQ